MMRVAGLALGGCVALASGVIVGGAMGNSKRKIELNPDRYNQIANTYDTEVASTEASSGIQKMRADLVSRAKGRVLETCAGTGRNNELYNPVAVKELILMDYSMEMLEEAKKKGFAQGLDNVRLIKSASLDVFEDESFDTVVDTFGLCSVPDPEAFLQDVKRVLKPSGHALFLEHGRNESTGIISWFVNNWLDFRASAHAKKYGCLWNRELGKAIESAGFKILEKSVHHAGTCTVVHAEKVAE